MREFPLKFLCFVAAVASLTALPVIADPCQTNETSAECVKYFREKAEQGDAEAQFYLGLMYYNKDGAENERKAVFWHVKSAKQGIAEAQHNLGSMYDHGKGVGKNKERALYWYSKAAEQGNPRSQYSLGVMFYNGEVVPQDYREATEWISMSARQGYEQAQYILGAMYEEGRGVSQNYRKAVHWYQAAAEQGDLRAQERLSVMYEQGIGVEKNADNASYWRRKKEEQQRAMMPMIEAGLKKLNEREAAKRAKQGKFILFIEEHFGGDRKALLLFGVIILLMTSVHFARKTWRKWLLKTNKQSVAEYGRLREAAGRGDAKSQQDLAYMYVAGEGVSKNYSEATHWLHAAAEQGLTDAQLGLGMLYTDMLKNHREGYIWTVVAKASGCKEADEFIREVRWKLIPKEFVSAVEEAMRRFDEIEKRRNSKTE